MFITFLFFWVLSASSYGLSLQQPQSPVDYGRNYNVAPASTNASVQHPLLQTNRGPGQRQSQNFALDSSHPNSHEDSHQHHDTHHHGGHKLKKLEIQKYITQRDLEKQSRNEPTWKTYFAEILAATILTSGIVTFLCWYNWTKRRGRRTSRSSHPFAGTNAAQERRLQRQQTFQRGASMPNIPINLLPNGQSPKLSPATKKVNLNRKPNQKEIPSPANV